MRNRVECPGQVRVQDPPALAAVAAQRLEDGLDRVVAAPARPESVRSRLEPGLPLGFQRVFHASLLRAIRDHGNAERALLLRTCFRDEHPPDGPGFPGLGVTVQPPRQLSPVAGGQRDLPVDARRLAASVALRDLPHADQRVGQAPQHQLLQVTDLLPVLLPRRLEDPLPQPPYLVLAGAPVNGVPVENRVLRSVHFEGWHRKSECMCHHLCLTCPSVPVPWLQSVKGSPGPRQPPFGPGNACIRPVMRGGPRRARPSCPGFPPPFGAPAFASWTVLRPPGSSGLPHGRLTGHQPGPRRGCHVPHGRDPAGVGAPCTPGRRCPRGWLLVTSRRLPLPSGQPCPRPRIPSPGVSISGHQREFACAHPSGLPLACGPRMERALLGVSPDAPHPAVTGSARQGGDGSTNTNPELRCCHHAQPSFQRAHSNRATSCRTEEIKTLIEADDLRLVLVEGQPSGRQPLRQPRLDLGGLLLAVAEHNHVIGVPDRHRRPGYGIPGTGAGGPVRTPAASSSPCNATFSKHGEITPPWGVPSPVGANPLPASNTPAFSQSRIRSLAGNDPRAARR